MKKLLMTIIIVIIIIVIVFLNAPKEKTLTYIDEKHGFTITIPETWENYYETVPTEEGVVFNYLAENNTKALLLIISVYPSSINLFELINTPNTEIIAQTTEKYFTLSQPLDMPFMPGTLDFERYPRMLEKLDEVIKSIKTDTNYTLNHKITEVKDEKQYIDVSYPEIKGEKDFSEINKVIKQGAEKFVSEFKENLEEWGDIEMPEGAYSTFWMHYQPTLLDKHASIYFIISENMGGAAHPNSYTYSLTFDIETNTKIEITDVISDIDKLAEMVKSKLKEQFEERGAETDNLFEIGTQAKPENYDNFNLTSRGITFNFSPYEIASYAVGGFTVMISYDELENILKQGF